MAHNKVYVTCENLCKEEGMTKTQIEELIDTRVSNATSNINNSIGQTVNTNATQIINGRFAVLTGEITISSGASSYGVVNVNYPSGFNKDNCVPVSIGVSWYKVGDSSDSTLDYNTCDHKATYNVRLTSSKVGLSVQQLNGTIYQAGTYKYKIVLMKVS